MADITIAVDNSDRVLNELERNVQAALEACGQQAVSHAKQNITAASRVDTGAMRNSVNHRVNTAEGVLYVGTNQEYAIYNEYGTGIYTDGGRGRKTPWRYVDAKGVGHWTHGMKPIHFLKNAIANNVNEYKSIIEEYLKR